MIAGTLFAYVRGGRVIMPSIPARRRSLPISKVRTQGAHHQSAQQLVYCQRRSESVAVERCRECPHFLSQKLANGDAGAIVCEEAPLDPERAASFSLPRLSVADLMTRDVLCVRPDLSLDVAVLLLLEQAGKTLPVVDEHGHVLGTVRDADLQLEALSERSVQATVADAMTPSTVTIPETMPITRAAALMAFEGVDCLVAVSPAGAVVGLLAAADLLFWLACADGYLPRARRCVPT
jgi:CBS domain-containing protein